MVAERMKEGKDEQTAKTEVMKELRQAVKAKKKGKHEEAERIKAEIEASMAGSDKNLVEKAVRRAVAKHFSQLKKAKKPSVQLKTRANKLIVSVHSQLWCPSDKAWWDDECQARFEDMETLAAMNSINILKAPQNFGKMYPSECKKYFDFLAKKRFNAADPEALKPIETGKKINKSSLQRKFEDKKAEIGEQKTSDNKVLEVVINEISEAEKEKALINVRRQWKPAYKPWFDETCRESFSKLTDLALSQNFDLDSRAGDFKKFKLKNKDVCKVHFALMEEKRKAFNLKQNVKEERKKDLLKQKKEKEAEAAIPDGFAKGQNKKINFEDDADDALKEEDIDATIKTVDKNLKKMKKKEMKEKKKASIEAKNTDSSKELDPKKLKKIQKEKERRKRKKAAEAASTTNGENDKSVVDFTEEGEKENQPSPPAKKKSKKIKFDS